MHDKQTNCTDCSDSSLLYTCNYNEDNFLPVKHAGKEVLYFNLLLSESEEAPKIDKSSP